MSDKIRQLIAADKLQLAIEELMSQVSGRRKDLASQLIQYQATLTKNRNDFRRGLISSEQENQILVRVRFALLDMMAEIEEIAQSPNDSLSARQCTDPARSVSPTVFISYNHEDSDIAGKLRQALEQNGIVVHIDQAVMAAGANIEEFIESSIRDTNVTLCVVSNRSLLSAWVALESIHTFYQEKFERGKRFIAGYLDTDFFHNDFRLNATHQIDAKIEEIDRLIPEYIASKIDTNDLNAQKSRLFKLRNNLGDILLRLRDTLTLDFREDKFEESVAKIVREIS